MLRYFLFQLLKIIKSESSQLKAKIRPRRILIGWKRKLPASTTNTFLAIVYLWGLNYNTEFLASTFHSGSSTSGTNRPGAASPVFGIRARFCSKRLRRNSQNLLRKCLAYASPEGFPDPSIVVESSDGISEVMTTLGRFRSKFILRNTFTRPEHSSVDTLNARNVLFSRPSP